LSGRWQGGNTDCIGVPASGEFDTLAFGFGLLLLGFFNQRLPTEQNGERQCDREDKVLLVHRASGPWMRHGNTVFVVEM
jgi:hypothetical protein